MFQRERLYHNDINFEAKVLNYVESLIYIMDEVGSSVCEVWWPNGLAAFEINDDCTLKALEFYDSAWQNTVRSYLISSLYCAANAGHELWIIRSENASIVVENTTNPYTGKSHYSFAPPRRFCPEVVEMLVSNNYPTKSLMNQIFGYCSLKITEPESSQGLSEDWLYLSSSISNDLLKLPEMGRVWAHYLECKTQPLLSGTLLNFDYLSSVQLKAIAETENGAVGIYRIYEHILECHFRARYRFGDLHEFLKSPVYRKEVSHTINRIFNGSTLKLLQLGGAFDPLDLSKVKHNVRSMMELSVLQCRTFNSHYKDYNNSTIQFDEMVNIELAIQSIAWDITNTTMQSIRFSDLMLLHARYEMVEQKWQKSIMTFQSDLTLLDKCRFNSRELQRGTSVEYSLDHWETHTPKAAWN